VGNANESKTKRMLTVHETNSTAVVDDELASLSHIKVPAMGVDEGEREPATAFMVQDSTEMVSASNKGFESHM